MSDYQQHSITITLNFDTMNLPADLDMDVVAKMLTNDEWRDGRYPFYTEMIHVGLAHKLEYAIGDAVGKAMEKKYGRQTVLQEGSNGNSMMSVAHLKTQEAMQGVSANILDSIKAAKIGKPVKDER